MGSQFPAAASGVRALLLAWAALTLTFIWSDAPAPWLHVWARHAPLEPLEPLEPLVLSDIHRRKDNPLVDMVAGTLGAAISFVLLWMNEGHAVRMDQLLQFATRRVRSIQASPASVENRRHFVFLNGEARTADRLMLPEWGSLSAPPNAFKLRATALMYQWEEEKDDKNVSYAKAWKHHRVNSDRFQQSGYENPPFPVVPACMALAKVRVGDFILPQKMLGKFQNYQPCGVSDQVLQEIQAGHRMSSYGPGVRTQHRASLLGSKEAIFFPRIGGGTASNPAVGDLMVMFEYAPCTPVTLLAVQVPFTGSPDGRIFVPGTRCQARGRPAEITEVTPPPRPIQVHYTDTRKPDYEFLEMGELSGMLTEPWPADAASWTFAPLQFTQGKELRPAMLRAHTGVTNLADEAGQHLLGENEPDVYIEEEQSGISHVMHGVTSMTKMLDITWSPTRLSAAFLSGSSPDEICVALIGTYTCKQALRQEKANEMRVNAAVRLFGFYLMAVGFHNMMRPLTWALSYLWIFGTMLNLLVHLGSCCCALACSGCTMGTAWVAYRPAYGLGIFLLCMLLLFYSKQTSDAPSW